MRKTILVFAFVGVALAVPLSQISEVPKTATADATATNETASAIVASAAEANATVQATNATSPAIVNDKIIGEVLPKDGKTVAPPPKPASSIADIPGVIAPKDPLPNMPNEHYPVDPKVANYAIKESANVVAGVPMIDTSNKSLWGIPTEPKTFDLTNSIHPMELKTPLSPQPCDPDNVLHVEIPAAQYKDGYSIPVLPSDYGCTGQYDVGREKASPEVRWFGTSEDTVDFSLEMISMGDATCPGVGAGSGEVHWIVTGIKSAPLVTLPKGASKDSRLLRNGTEGTNQWLEDYYSGPCPMPGVMSCYRFRVLGHRANGLCQCGFQDVLFFRPEKKTEVQVTYEEPILAPVGAKKD